jgi:hypothetical protein
LIRAHDDAVTNGFDPDAIRALLFRTDLDSFFV